MPTADEALPLFSSMFSATCGSSCGRQRGPTAEPFSGKSAMPVRPDGGRHPAQGPAGDSYTWQVSQAGLVANSHVSVSKDDVGQDGP